MPKWVWAVTGSLILLLLTLVGWLLSWIFTSITGEVTKMSEIVYQVRQDVAVISARMDTTNKNCDCTKKRGTNERRD